MKLSSCGRDRRGQAGICRDAVVDHNLCRFRHDRGGSSRLDLKGR
jgi:hypothetical protein